MRCLEWMARWTALAACGTALAGPGDLRVHSFVIDTGAADSQTILHGRLTDRSAVDEFFVFSRDKDGGRRLAVYGFAGDTWGVIHEAAVDADVIFADVVELGGRDRLLLYGRGGRLDWLSPANWTRKPLLQASSLYRVPPPDVPHADIGRDINGDELEDIAIADFDGYWVWLQTPAGELAEGVKLAAPATATTNFEAATYRPRTLYALDYDGDGVTDLAAWDERFLIYRGTFGYGFDAAPLELAPPLQFESDDAVVSFGFGADNDSTTTMLANLKDYNGDGVGDIATTTVNMDGLFDQSTRYDFHFGERSGRRTIFRAEPDTRISSPSLQAPFAEKDINGDDRVDFAMGSVDIGIGMLIRVLLTGTVRFDIDFYTMGAAGYPADANVSRPVKMRFSLASGDLLSGNWVEIGDMDGDGVGDLIAHHDETRIDVFRGTADAALFAEDALHLEVDMPDGHILPFDVETTDLNADGRDDLVMRFPADDEHDSNRIGIVLSR